MNLSFDKMEKRQLAFCGILSYSTLAMIVGDVSLFLFLVPASYPIGSQLFPTYFLRLRLKPGRTFFIGYLIYVFILILIMGEDSLVLLELPFLYFFGYKLLPRFLSKDHFQPKRAFVGGYLFYLCITLTTYILYAFVFLIFYILKYLLTVQAFDLSAGLQKLITNILDYGSILDRLDIYTLAIIVIMKLAFFQTPLIIGGASILLLAYLIPRYYDTQPPSLLNPNA